MARLHTLLALLCVVVLAACDASEDLDAGASIDASPVADAGPSSDDGGAADAGPAAGTLDVEIDGLPSGAHAWVAVAARRADSRWVRQSERLTFDPGHVVVAAAPVAIDGVSYVPTPALEALDLSTSAGSVTIAYAPAPTDFFEAEPDFSTCTAGVLTTGSRERAVAMLHFLRALVGVPPVAYDAAPEPTVGQAAVVYANSDSPDPHAPPSDAPCYTTGAFEMAGASNLRWVGSSRLANVTDETPESFVQLWGVDRDVRSLGHRRWLVDPFLPRVSYAMTYGEVQPGPYARSYTYVSAAAMHVIHDDEASLDGWDIDYVAYPVGDFPAAFLDLEAFPYLSFSAMADAGSRWGANQNMVDFTAATVSMTDGSGAAVPVSDVEYDTRGIGLPNSISWRADGLSVEETYTVAITGAQVGGSNRDYEYDFTLY